MELTIDTGNARLPATLTLPAGVPRAGLVPLHGAEAGARSHVLYEQLATVLPPHGIAVLRYDRRAGTNDIPYDVQASDACAAIRLLRRHVDGPTGLWAWSQGGFAAPLAAAREAVAFLVAVSVSGVSPAEQMRYGTAEQLRRNGFPAADRQRLAELRAAYEDYLRGTRDRDDVQAVIDRAAGRPWFPLAYVRRHLTGDLRWPDLDFDPEPVLAAVPCPVLAYYGEDDEWVPVEPSVRAWRHTERVRIERLPGCGHAPTLADGSISPRYTETLLEFLS